MPNGIIFFNGTGSDFYGLKVEHYPDLFYPAPNYERISVPGRNGDLIFYDGSYSNVPRRYEVFAGNKSDAYGAPVTWAAITEWLRTQEEAPTIEAYRLLQYGGYKQLTDSYDLNSIRLAMYVEDIEAANSWNRFARATLTFDCRPERFGPTAFNIQNTVPGETLHLYNSTRNNAKPFIKITGSGAAHIVIGAYVVDVSNVPGELYIDCERQDCFRALAENMNNLVTLTNGFPQLVPGHNDITITGEGIDSLSITPRWFNI